MNTNLHYKLYNQYAFTIINVYFSYYKILITQNIKC